MWMTQILGEDWRVAQVVELLPNKCKALIQISIPPKKKKKKKKVLGTSPI
jgi:hypothetical protein